MRTAETAAEALVPGLIAASLVVAISVTSGAGLVRAKSIEEAAGDPPASSSAAPVADLAAGGHAPLGAGATDGARFRVRTTEPRIRQGLDQGYRQSRTFRALVDALERSDLIIYIQERNPSSAIAASIGGYLQILGSRGAHRYVLITLTPKLMRSRLVAMIAHELQHALEVSQASAVMDVESLLAHYRRTGDLVGPSREQYDTATARDITSRVLVELATPERR